MATRDVSKHYNEVQHDPLSPAPTEFDDLDLSEIIEQIRNWFFSNFEDPVAHTPYESAEGGYQYIWGGPYETRDIIETIFSDDLTEEQFEAVVDDIDSDGIEWVPNQRRLQAPDEFEPDDFTRPTSAQQHERMLALVSEAERQVLDFEKEQFPGIPGIGHNHPPGPVSDDAPASKQDIAEIKAALEALKKQPEVPSEAGQEEAKKSQGTLEKYAKKIAAWAAKKAGDYIIGGAATAASLYLDLPNALQNVVNAVGQWLASINLPF